VFVVQLVPRLVRDPADCADRCAADQRRGNGRYQGSSTELTTITREEFRAAVDWERVRRDVLEHRAGLESMIVQRTAEVRAAVRHPWLRDQEQRARWQDNVDACDELIAALGRIAESQFSSRGKPLGVHAGRIR
jgi:hypothetical protein